MTIRYLTIASPGPQGRPGEPGDENAEYGGEFIRDPILKMWVSSGAYAVTSVNRDIDGLPATASVVWPDGSTGTLTVNQTSAQWLAVDAFIITHDLSGKAVTQPAVTRDATGLVSNTPALTVTGGA